MAVFFVLLMFGGAKRASAQAECFADTYSIKAGTTGEVEAGENVMFYVDTKGASLEDNELVGYIRIYRRDPDGTESLVKEPEGIYYYDNAALCGGYHSCYGINAPQVNGEYFAIITNSSNINNFQTCSNASESFVLTNYEVPTDCVNLGEMCCLDESGECPLGGNPTCCNICQPPAEDIKYFCNFGTGLVEEVTLEDCGFARGMVCCSNEDNTIFSCNGTLVPSSQDNSCVCGGKAPPKEDNLSLWCEENKTLNTAIGCIPIVDYNPFLRFILVWAIGVAGGIGLVLMVIASFMLAVSRGDRRSRAFNNGRDMFISAISGVIFAVLSVYLLKVIGVDILGLGF